MSDSAFHSDAERQERNRQNEDSSRLLIEMEKTRFDLMQREAKLQADGWRDQQSSAERFYRQLTTSELQYQRTLQGRYSSFPSGAAPASPAGAPMPAGMAQPVSALASAPAAAYSSASQGAANQVAAIITPYMKTAAAAFAIPTTALGAFAAALTAGFKAVEAFNSGFTLLGFNRGQAEDAWIKSNPMFNALGLDTARNQHHWAYEHGFKLPTSFFGGGDTRTPEEKAADASYEGSTTYRQREFNKQASNIDRQEGEAASGIRARADRESRRLHSERREMQSQLDFGVNTNAAEANIQRFAIGARATAMAGAGGISGYGRQAEQEDIARRSAMGESLATISMKSQRETAMFQKRDEQNKWQEHGLEEDVKKKQAAVDKQQKVVDFYNNPNQPGGAQLEKAAIENNTLQVLMSGRQHALDQAREAHAKTLGDERAQYNAVNAASKEWNGTLMANRKAIADLAQAEKDKARGRAEHLGVMYPGEANALEEVSKRYRKFGIKGMTMRDLHVMERHPEFAAAQVAEYGRMMDEKRGGQAARIGEGFNLGARGAALDKEAAVIDHKIQVDVAGMDGVMGDMIKDKLMPGLNKMMADFQQQATAALEKLAADIKAKKGGMAVTN